MINYNLSTSMSVTATDQATTWASQTVRSYSGSVKVSEASNFISWSRRFYHEDENSVTIDMKSLFDDLRTEVSFDRIYSALIIVDSGKLSLAADSTKAWAYQPFDATGNGITCSSDENGAGVFQLSSNSGFEVPADSSEWTFTWLDSKSFADTTFDVYLYGSGFATLGDQ